jgi:hypothetical protein
MGWMMEKWNVVMFVILMISPVIPKFLLVIPNAVRDLHSGILVMVCVDCLWQVGRRVLE